MPIIQSNYKAPFYLFNRHLQTIIPGVFRKVEGVEYQRERLELPDDDFVDLDWLKKNSKKVAILTHGLEGDSSRHYIRGTAKLLHSNGWDVCAWNCRSCSGEMNRQQRMYHHADIADISEVVKYCISMGYTEISLLGFSMGGSITLNYLGNMAENLPKEVKNGIAISAPCDLVSSVGLLNERSNFLYKHKFLKRLTAKMIEKSKRFPDVIDIKNLDKVKRWEDFDLHFSAPLNHFKTPQEFYEKASAIRTMHQISVPTYILTSINDPLLSEACFPIEIAEKNQNIKLEITKTGGHLGYTVHNQAFTYSEIRSLDFLNQKI
jgi:uncharacterized protein